MEQGPQQQQDPAGLLGKPRAALRRLLSREDSFKVKAAALPRQASPRVATADCDEKQSHLVVMSLNLQYFASFPKDEAVGIERLREATSGPVPPDVICVQEGIAGRDVLGPLGYDLCVCSGATPVPPVAQSVREMVYSDKVTLSACDESVHDRYLTNQIYVRRSSDWQYVAHGFKQISSDHELQGGGGRAEGTLAVRSVVWTKMHKASGNASDVFILNTHLTGGRFEDQYFVQQLAQERLQQPERIMSLFENEATADDVGILIGDFNATHTYTEKGPMHNYFKFSIAGSEGVEADAVRRTEDKDGALEDHFARYMTSPFQAITKKGWTFAYGEEVGVTSAFGHLIDHMAMSRPLPVVSAEVVYLTNQKIGQQPKVIDVPVTDHNAVKAVFCVSREGKELCTNEDADYSPVAGVGDAVDPNPVADLVLVR